MKQITEYLYSLRNKGAKLGLERMEALAEALGNPQKSFRSVLIGGTSGKGSTVAMLSSILKEAGYATGRYTSPHLSRLTERIVVDGIEIDEQELAEIIAEIKKTVDSGKFEHPTFFEVMTAAAFLYFKKRKVDFAVLEVGLGGRLDATRIASPTVSVITNVSLEHTRILGDTVEKIAKEKAGIIQEHGILITTAKDDALRVFETVCKGRNCKLVVPEVRRLESSEEWQVFGARVQEKDCGTYRLPLPGRHQLENAGCALGAVYALQSLGFTIPHDSISQGLLKTSWPGRMETVQQKPRVILDCAKDAAAMKMLREAIQGFKYRKLIAVVSISSDKNILEMMKDIEAMADFVIVTEHKVMERAAKTEQLASVLVKKPIVVRDVKDAVKKAMEMAGEEDLILVTGSVFTVAEAREIWFTPGEKSWGREMNEVPKA